MEKIMGEQWAKNNLNPLKAFRSVESLPWVQYSVLIPPLHLFLIHPSKQYKYKYPPPLATQLTIRLLENCTFSLLPQPLKFLWSSSLSSYLAFSSISYTNLSFTKWASYIIFLPPYSWTTRDLLHLWRQEGQNLEEYVSFVVVVVATNEYLVTQHSSLARKWYQRFNYCITKGCCFGHAFLYIS